MTARRPPEDAVLVLKANEIDPIDVQEIRRSTIGSRITFLNFEAHAGRIGVPALPIIDRNGETAGLGTFRRHGFAQIRGEGGNPAAPGQIIPDEGDAFEGKRFREIHAHSSLQALYRSILN